MNITEMLAERKRLMDEAKAIQATADKEERGLTEEEEASITANLAAAAELKGQIEAARETEQRQAALRTQLADEDAWEAQVQPRLTRQPAAGTAFPSPAVRTDGRTDAPPNPNERATFSSFGEQLQAVVRAENKHIERDSRLVPFGAVSGMNEGVGSEGGFSSVRTRATSCSNGCTTTTRSSVAEPGILARPVSRFRQTRTRSSSRPSTKPPARTAPDSVASRRAGLTRPEPSPTRRRRSGRWS